MTPFYSLTHKRPGDRVKIQKHPADASRGFDYGTVRRVGPDNHLYVFWDQKTPYLSRRTGILCAILV